METLLGLAYRAFNHGRSYQQSIEHRKAVRYAKEKARTLEQRPSPLPKARRNLSQTSLSLHPQPTCPLLTRLPPEIRQRIYVYVLGGRIIHLTHISKRIVHQQLEISEHQLNDEEPPTGEIPIQMPPNIEWDDELTRIPHRPQFSTVDLSLLQTCHAIYAEAIPSLYNSNTFSMASPLVLLYIKDYILLPQRFEEIRHLQLIPWVYFENPEHFTGRIHAPYDEKTWSNFWTVVAGMGLRSLGLWVEYWGKAEECCIDADWIKPLLKVKGVNEVGIQLQFRAGPWDTRRLRGLEKDIEKSWEEK